MYALPFETSVSPAALPPATNIKLSSAGPGDRVNRIKVFARCCPSIPNANPNRWHAETAFGLAKTTFPSKSIRKKPSPTRGGNEVLPTPAP